MLQVRATGIEEEKEVTFVIHGAAFGPTYGTKVNIWAISIVRCFHCCSLYSQYVLLTRRMPMDESTRR
jgi:hypothetical protein